MMIFKSTADSVSKQYLKTTVKLDTLSGEWTKEAKSLSIKSRRILRFRSKVLRTILRFESMFHSKVKAHLISIQKRIDDAETEAQKCKSLATNFKKLLEVTE